MCHPISSPSPASFAARSERVNRFDLRLLQPLLVVRPPFDWIGKKRHTPKDIADERERFQEMFELHL
jgi:hypothetical protein